MQMKSAAEQLAQRDLLGQDTFTRKSDTGEYLGQEDDEVIKVGLFELIDAFQRILENASQESTFELDADTISVKDKINELVEILEEKESVAFDELFTALTEKSEIIVTFLAILEMVKLRLVHIFQHIQTGIIRLIYQ
jgi:segregation and condensation protein A